MANSSAAVALSVGVSASAAPESDQHLEELLARGCSADAPAGMARNPKSFADSANSRYRAA